MEKIDKDEWKHLNKAFLLVLFRSSRPEAFFGKAIMENFLKFTGKQQYMSLF